MVFFLPVPSMTPWRMEYNQGMDPFLATIRDEMLRQNVSISKLAKLSGVARPHLSRAFSGHCTLTLPRCQRIAAALGLTLTAQKTTTPS